MSKKCILFSSLFLALLAEISLPFTSSGEDLTSRDLAAKIQAKYESLVSIIADFQQVTTIQFSSQKRRGSGTVVIRKPGKMRWDYIAPDQQVILCDGKTLSIYLAKSEQMIVGPAQRYLESDVTYSFLTGKGNILKDFEVFKAEELFHETGFHVLKLVPKLPHPQIDHLYLWTDREYIINKIKIFDQLGSETTLHFENVKINQPIPKGYFSFTPPEGTEIINQ